MKKNIKILSTKILGSVVLVSLLFVSCSKGNAPEAVAKKFLTHMNKLEFEEAKKLCDEKTAGLVEMAAGLANMGKSLVDKKDLKKDVEIKIIKTEVKDDLATVTYKEGDKDKEQQLTLKKIDGKWKVSMNKEDMKKEGTQPEITPVDTTATE